MDSPKFNVPTLFEGKKPCLKHVSSSRRAKSVPLRYIGRDADPDGKAQAKTGHVGDCYFKFADDDLEPSDFSELARGLPRHTHWRQLALPVGALVFYYLLGFLFYHFTMSWGFVDCVYFSTVLMMTVGYGDLIPEGDLALLFTTCYAMLAFTLVATAVSKLFDSSIVLRMLHERRQQKKRVSNMLLGIQSTGNLSSQAPVLPHLAANVRKGLGWTIRQLLQPNAECVPLFDEDARRLRNLKGVIAAAAYLLFWIALGTVINASFHHLPGDYSENELLQAFYFSVITLTTVGFGHVVPKTIPAKFFDIFYILLGVPICVNSIAKFVTYIWGEENSQQHVDILQGLCGEKLNTMLEFKECMSKAGCGNTVDDQISRSEFLLFVLVRNEIVDMETVKEIMNNFDSLDEVGSGFLSYEDVKRSDSDEEVIQDNMDRSSSV